VCARAPTHTHTHTARVHKHTCVHAHTRAIVLGKSLLLTISHVVAPHAFEHLVLRSRDNLLS
jgi:hypothetical protein